MACSKIIHGDCVEVMKGMAENSVDAIVTDPPYELGFMGKSWDASGIAYNVEMWRQCLRVLKPGGHLLAFGGSRTYHRLACAVEDAGFEIRDQIMWVYGSGFPKSLDVSKAIDKAAGVRGHDGVRFNVAGGGHAPNGGSKFRSDHPNYIRPEGITDAARQWQGFGTALKPSHEPVVVARKPLIGTVAENVQKWGTGALNVDGCRVGSDTMTSGGSIPDIRGNSSNGKGISGQNNRDLDRLKTPIQTKEGRWPANLIHDGSEEVVGLFPDSKSCNSPSKAKPESKYRPGQGSYQPQGTIYPGDSGSAARFFYCAKASKRERGEGNNHPTVKPIALMRYLCRLVTPPGGVVLDPFAGSGTTLIAAEAEGFECIGIEKDEAYREIARSRVESDLWGRQ